MLNFLALSKPVTVHLGEELAFSGKLTRVHIGTGDVEVETERDANRDDGSVSRIR